MSDRYSIIDIETSGSFKKGHKITELAIINMDGNDVVEELRGDDGLHVLKSLPRPVRKEIIEIL